MLPSFMALILIVKSKCTKWDSSLALVWSRSSENWLVETLQQDGHSSSAVSAVCRRSQLGISTSALAILTWVMTCGNVLLFCWHRRWPVLTDYTTSWSTVWDYDNLGAGPELGCCCPQSPAGQFRELLQIKYCTFQICKRSVGKPFPPLTCD